MLLQSTKHECCCSRGGAGSTWLLACHKQWRGVQGSCVVPGSRPALESDMVSCTISSTQHMSLPVPKPLVIAPAHFGPFWWHQLNSWVHHQQAAGGFTVSCSRHLPMNCFNPVVQKLTGRRSHCDTVFHLFGHQSLIQFAGGGCKKSRHRSLNPLEPFSAFSQEQ